MWSRSEAWSSTATRHHFRHLCGRVDSRGVGKNISHRQTNEKEPVVTTPGMQQRPPRVFIGSSGEGLPVAEAINRALEHGYEATVWSQGVFGPGGYNLESLIEQTKTREFAILVVDADDTTASRGKTKNVARDNVIFELGLFLGALGRERCFMVYDRDRQPDLPSDLLGITPATYGRHSDNDLDAALGPATSRIKLQIARIRDSHETPDVECLILPQKMSVAPSAVSSIPQPQGPLAPLIEAGLLNIGETLRFQQSRANRSATATVEADGSLSIEGKTTRFSSPSQAAGAVTGGQVNGWTLWRTSHGRTLDNLRAEL